MQTQVHPTQQHTANFYEHIAHHPETSGFYLLYDHDAIRFILDMGRIRLIGAPFASGSELLEYVVSNRLGAPQILFPHNSVIVFVTLDGQRPMVVVSTSALQMRAALKDLLTSITTQTAETLTFLINQQGAEHILPEVDEHPADAVVIFRPDLIPLADCYQDLRKLGYKGVLMVPGRIDIPYEHFKGGVHFEITPVTDQYLSGFYDFEDELLWGSIFFYVPKHFLAGGQHEPTT